MTSISLPETAEFRNFRRNELAVTHLASLMNDQVFQSALRIISDMAKPSRLPDTTPGVHADTCVTHHFHLLIGVNEAIEKLRKLAIAPIGAELDEVQPDRPEFQDHADKIQPMSLPQK